MFEFEDAEFDYDDLRDVPLEHRASGRTLAGFAHRARQLIDFVRVYLARGRLARR